MKNGKVSEILLDLPKTSKFDAASILKVMLKSLQDCGLEAKHIFSQCYDGASVIMGVFSGCSMNTQHSLQSIDVIIDQYGFCSTLINIFIWHIVSVLFSSLF